MKERRERVMGDFQTDAASEIDPIDYVIAERFRAERHPEESVDGDSRWDQDLYDLDDSELPGLWERADFME